MSVTEAYRLYRDGFLLVNRRYQRKLVWTVEEKQKLIDSILKGYPIPLLLLAGRPEAEGTGRYEIIDGMQRFNAIFTFIENAYDIQGEFFDIAQFARAKQAADQGTFEAASSRDKKLSPKSCADLLDYQLAVTIYPPRDPEDITEVFGRINANGRQLSPQEKRQAGVISPFSEMVRRVGAELRGDVSQDVLPLTQMPEISIEWKTNRQGYGVRAEETFWCKHGILSTRQLRDSEDEQLIADISASILLREPIAYSQELLDTFYDSNNSASKDLEAAIAAYGRDRLASEIKSVFSVIQTVVEQVDPTPSALRRVITPNAPTGTKTPFYALFMTFFDLVARQEQSPADVKAIINSITDLGSKLKTSTHYATTEDRKRNIAICRGLIQDHFVKKEPPVLGHGPGLAMDFENSVRRSRVETSRYEFKQGLLRLSADRALDAALLERIVDTICGIANLGPAGSGYVFIGVADKAQDAQKISQLDKVHPVNIADRYIVGIDREATILRSTIDDYVKRIAAAIKGSQLSDPLKSQCLASFDVVLYKGFSVVRITVPAQKSLSFVGDQAFTRQNSDTIEVKAGPHLIALSRLFS